MMGQTMKLTITVEPEERLELKVWRFLVFRRADGRCESCGQGRSDRRRRDVEAHHLNGDASDHRLANGRALCRRCHVDAHMVNDPEWRARQAREIWQRPDAGARREAARQKALALWSDPEWRARALAARAAGKKGGPRPRLTDQQVMVIRSRRELGEPLSVLAEEFGVSISLVSAIAHGKRRTG
jgi:hypothetical protein